MRTLTLVAGGLLLAACSNNSAPQQTARPQVRVPTYPQPYAQAPNRPAPPPMTPSTPSVRPAPPSYNAPSYGGSAYGGPPPIGNPTPASRPAPSGPSTGAAPRSGPIRWHHRLADAQADARATGRVILVGSTKPGCSLCDKFKNQVAPANTTAAGVAVGYMLDTSRLSGDPSAAQLWALMKANLPLSTELSS